MAQHSFAGFAVFVALAFALMALQGCASPEHAATAQLSTAAVVSTELETPATPEFHGANIGRDALRSRLSSEG